MQKVKVKRSIGSKGRVKTDRRRTETIALPPVLTRSMKRNIVSDVNAPLCRLKLFIVLSILADHIVMFTRVTYHYQPLAVLMQ